VKLRLRISQKDTEKKLFTMFRYVSYEDQLQKEPLKILFNPGFMQYGVECLLRDVVCYLAMDIIHSVHS